MTDEGEIDPRGLIREAYAIPGVTAAECRTIFLDWAISAPSDPSGGIRALLERHGAPGHPMTQVLEDGLAAPRVSGRRGGRTGRTR